MSSDRDDNKDTTTTTGSDDGGFFTTSFFSSFSTMTPPPPPYYYPSPPYASPTTPFDSNTESSQQYLEDGGPLSFDHIGGSNDNLMMMNDDDDSSWNVGATTNISPFLFSSSPPPPIAAAATAPGEPESRPESLLSCLEDASTTTTTTTTTMQTTRSNSYNSLYNLQKIVLDSDDNGGDDDGTTGSNDGIVSSAPEATNNRLEDFKNYDWNDGRRRRRAAAFQIQGRTKTDLLNSHTTLLDSLHDCFAANNNGDGGDTHRSSVVQISEEAGLFNKTTGLDCMDATALPAAIKVVTPVFDNGKYQFFPLSERNMDVLSTTMMVFSLSDNCGTMNVDDLWKSINDDSPVGTFCEPIASTTPTNVASTPPPPPPESQGYDTTTTTTTTTKSGSAGSIKLQGGAKINFLQSQNTLSAKFHSLNKDVDDNGNDDDDGAPCVSGGTTAADDLDTTIYNNVDRRIPLKEDTKPMFTMQDNPNRVERTTNFGAALPAVTSSNVVAATVAAGGGETSPTKDDFSKLSVLPLPKKTAIKQRAIKGGLRLYKKGDVEAVQRFYSKGEEMGLKPRFCINAEGDLKIHFNCPVKDTNRRVEASLDLYYYYEDYHEVDKCRTLLYMEVNPVGSEVHLCPSKSVEEILQYAAKAQNSYAKKNNKPDRIAQEPIKPSENDYCLGRGGKIAKHKGNIQVLKMRDKYSARMEACGSETEKKAVRKEFRQALDDKGTRFLENFNKGEGPEEGDWYEVEEKKKNNRIQTLLQPGTRKRRQACLTKGTTLKSGDGPRKRAKHP